MEATMKIIVTVLITMLLSSCAAIEPKQFVGPNGKTAYSMRCSGMGRTLDACYQKAGEVCPNGYTIIDRASGTVAVPVNHSIMAVPQHNLAIECK
jgi:hypothetical protein